MPQRKPQPVVELKDITVEYPNGVTAVENVSFDVTEKDFLGLVGPNGAGKSTLIKVILGLIKPTKGTVRLFGERISSKGLKNVGFIPQRVVTDGNFPATVFETVLFGRVALRSLPWFGKEDYQHVEAVLQLLEIGDLRDRKIGELSGGQFQRVSLAKALVNAPRILILDEPTSGIDVNSKQSFYRTLEKLNREMNTTVILASHELSIVRKLSTKVLCIDKSTMYCGDVAGFDQNIMPSDACEYLGGKTVE